LQKFPVVTVIREGDLIIGRWPPTVGQSLTEPVDEAFGKGIECEGVKSVGVVGMAAAADADCEIRGGIPLEADRENPARRPGESP